MENLINTVVNHKHLGNGLIILCHNGAYTAQALDSITYKKNYQMDHEGRQFSVGEEKNRVNRESRHRPDSFK